MSVELELEKGTESETVPPDEILAVRSVDLEHTAVSKYEVDLLPRTRYRDYQLGTGTLKVNGSTLIAGEIQQTPIDDDRITISGVGPVEQLREDTDIVTYQNIPVYEAIDDYATYTPAQEWNVVEPYIRDRGEDERFVDAPSIDGFDNVVNADADEPLNIDPLNFVELAQTCWFTEAENAQSTGITVDSNEAGIDFSGFEAEELSTGGDQVSIDFTPEYDVPASDIRFQVFFASPSLDGTLEMQINGEQVDEFITTGGDAGQLWFGPSDAPSSGFSAGVEQTVTVEITSYSSGEIYIDALAPYDTGDRFGGFDYFFDDTVDGDFVIDGPELYPDRYSFTVDLNNFWFVSQLETEIDINNTENNQQIEHTNTGGDTWIVGENTSYLNTDFDQENLFGDEGQVRLTLSRYTVDELVSPGSGDSNQRISNLTIDVWQGDLPVIGELTLDGDSWFENMQTLHERGDMRFVADHTDPNLVVESFRTGDPDVLKSSDWITATQDAVEYSRDTRDYFNRATVYAEPNSGVSPITLNDSADQNRVGLIKDRSKTTNATTQDELVQQARDFLRQGIQGDQFSGSIQIITEYFPPGYPYQPDEFDGNLANMETVRLGYDSDSEQASLNFGSRRSLVASIQGVKNG